MTSFKLSGSFVLLTLISQAAWAQKLQKNRADELGNGERAELETYLQNQGIATNRAGIQKYLQQVSPWENGYVESFNGKLRDELLNREFFLSLDEARWVIDRWQLDYNHHRIHSALDYQTPAAYAAGCVLPASAAPQPPEHSRVT